jgi:enoyl-[acyl-carrier-protein] reductase (NADH)
VLQEDGRAIAELCAKNGANIVVSYIMEDLKRQQKKCNKIWRESSGFCGKRLKKMMQ